MPNVRLPDGRIIKNVPAGTTKQALTEKLVAKGLLKAQEQFSKTESGIVGASQGVTAGFGDEIISGLTTPFIFGASKLAEQLGYDTKGLADKTLSEIYQMEQQKNQEGISQAKEQNPKTFLTGEVAGAIGSGAASLTTKGGQFVAKQIAKVPSASGQAAIVGSTSGALYGAGTAEQDQKLAGAGAGSLTGAVGGVVGQKVGTAAIGAVKKLLPKTDLRTIANKDLERVDYDSLKNLSSQAYATAEKEGGVLTPKFTNKLINKISNLDTKDPLIKKIIGEKPSSKFITKIQTVLKDKELTLKQVTDLDQDLTDQIGDSFNIATGKVDSNGKVLQNIQQSIRNSVETASQQDMIGKGLGFSVYKDARTLWSKSVKLRSIEKMVEKAKLTDTPATSMKTQFRSLVTNDKKLKGFSEKEKKIIRKVAKTGVVTDLFRILGNRFIGGAAGFAAGGIPGAAMGIATTQTARKIAEKLQTRQTDKLMDEIVRGVRKTRKTTKSNLLSIGQAPITTNE